MYDPFTGELNREVAKVPDALVQPRVEHLLPGQFAMVNVTAIWVNDESEVRLDAKAPVLDQQEVAEDILGGEFVSVIVLNEGLVLDALTAVTQRPFGIKLEQPSLEAVRENNFELGNFLPVIWVVATSADQVALKSKFKEQTGMPLKRTTDKKLNQVKRRRPKAGAVESTDESVQTASED